MNQAEQIMRSELDGNFWQLCNVTNSIIHKRVPLDYIPSHSGFDYSEAGKLARRNSSLTHRNKKRNLEADDMDAIKRLMRYSSNMEDIALAFHKQGRKASARAVYIAVRQIRAANNE